MSRRLMLIIGASVAAVAVLAALYVFVIAPGGEDTAQAAALEHVADRADGQSAKVLTQHDWGDGQLVLLGYDRRGVRRLAIAFAAKSFRGWKVSSYTEETVEPDDVKVGSLLIASSDGGGGQPPWTAAVGELLDARIDRVDVKWSTGDNTIGPRVGEAYMVVERGNTTAEEVRYLADNGEEIARVPVGG